MAFLKTLLLGTLGLAPEVLAANLLASHYTGKIFSLSFTGRGSNATLVNKSSVSGCGRLPAWLHVDSRVVYCVDEDWFGSGVLASYSVASDGSLKQTGSASTAGASVHGTPYGGENGKGFFATVEYDPSTLTRYKLPLSSASTVMAQSKFNMSAPGPNARQNAPHPHAAQLDPTGRFLIVPDLGADLIRIFRIDAKTGGLTACEPGVAGAGDGPRHGAWWGSPDLGRTAGRMLYTVNELGNSVSAWKVAYTDEGCLSLNRTQTLSTYAAGSAPPNGSKAAEVRVAGNFLYAANRADETFGPQNDSLATYSIDARSGAIQFVEATPAHAWFPRTFSINKAGDLVAVGGQTSSNVAIIARDPKTGKLGDLVANLKIATPGTPQQEDGLSAVVWVE
ncbi:3-carboxy-cis,cis-mucoante lactonizing enzyme [Daldinia caldariorum]|uniref:3-carboxy-cis,cis-mucoante lactonizing enzyme n=1 Tax=Daldinia caldariorum TaxID=326644 RepID=UPI0020075DA0|nr:3-carboxy-cis,cis-mucoante lactonizing enzyme [Daldinia caldariorum]KAI1463379.1 3-carboxy-cis,cis-mucoante lactonizing enzyme [Daldinia caldariorum]